MLAAPSVSIIIPTYNHAEFLRAALQSIVVQSFSDWEALVINNFSEDHTIEIVESFADPRIRLENFHNHGIIAASRNRGISIAQGQYLAFLDSDDTWYPEKLARCLVHLNENTDLVCHGLRYIGDIKRNVYCGPESQATYEALITKKNCLITSATIVKKELVELVGGFSEEPAVVTSEDYHLWIKLAKVGTRMKFLKEILGEYRVHTGNQSGSVQKHLDSVLSVVKEFYPPETSRTILASMSVRRRFGAAYYSAGRDFQKSSQYDKAWPLLFRSLMLWPFSIKCYIAIILNLAGCKLFILDAV